MSATPIFQRLQKPLIIFIPSCRFLSGAQFCDGFETVSRDIGTKLTF